MYRSASLGDRNLVHPAIPVGGHTVTDLPLPDGRPGRAAAFLFAPTAEAGALPSPSKLTLLVVRERGALDARLLGMSLALGALGVVLLVAMPLVVVRVVRQSLSALIALGRDVDAIDLVSLDRRLPTAGLHVEFVPIAERINQLLDRIQDGVLRERRFSDEVAHQLRTPIAELRALADVSLAGLGAEASRHRQVLEDAREIAIQMERLATGLLAIARGESDRRMGTSPVDLRAIAARATVDVARRSGDRGIRIASPRDQDGPPITVVVDQSMVESVLASLVENAVAYTPRGGEIEISTEVAGAVARLTVTNTDSTLDDEDLPRIFERFWRKEQSRSGGEHSGLGLAVALAMTRAMGGELAADRPAPGLFRMTLSIPTLADVRSEQPAEG